MAMQDCGGSAEARDLMAQDTALELFHIAALMLGDEEDAVALVEETVARVEADPCADAVAAHDEARTRLIQGAVRRIARRNPAALAAPEPVQQAIVTCIETDDLSAAGLNDAQIESLLAGPGRARMREWLEQLAPAQRVVFVLRAIVGQGGERAAEELRRSEDPGAQSWTADGVSGAYRQALCSLATSLAMSSAMALPA